MVKVAGLSKAFKMDFDDVLVMAEDAYHITQRNYSPDISITMSMGGAETGGEDRVRRALGRLARAEHQQFREHSGSRSHCDFEYDEKLQRDSSAGHDHEHPLTIPDP